MLFSSTKRGSTLVSSGLLACLMLLLGPCICFRNACPAKCLSRSHRSSFFSELGAAKDVGAFIVSEKSLQIEISPEDDIFFNEEQDINRDLSTLVVRVFAEEERGAAAAGGRGARAAAAAAATEGGGGGGGDGGLRVLDAFCASGVRALRYLREVPAVTWVSANDLAPAAAQLAGANARRNGVPPAAFEVTCGDAAEVMRGHARRGALFDVVDLDPFGSAAPFVDAALGCLADGGLLAVTCTDSMTFSHQREVAFQKYGAAALGKHGRGYVHEMALRMILHKLDTCAAAQGRSVTALLSLSLDHYFRVFVRVDRSARGALGALGRSALVYQAAGTPEFHLHPLGQPMGPEVARALAAWGEEGRGCVVGGPIWRGPLHDPAFVARLRAAAAEEEARVSASSMGVADEEATRDHPGPERREEEIAGGAGAGAGSGPVADERAKAKRRRLQRLRGVFLGEGGGGEEGDGEGAGGAADEGQGPAAAIGAAGGGCPEGAAGELARRRRLGQLLAAVAREGEGGTGLPPLYYQLTPGLSSAAGVRHVPALAPLAAALRRDGHLATRVHRDPRGIKTTAPYSRLIDLARTWDKRHWERRRAADPAVAVPPSVEAFAPAVGPDGRPLFPPLLGDEGGRDGDGDGDGDGEGGGGGDGEGGGGGAAPAPTVATTMGFVRKSRTGPMSKKAARQRLLVEKRPE